MTRSIVRWVSLALFLSAGVWLLWPAPQESPTNGSNESKKAPSNPANIRYVIKFSPGYFFMPDSIPYGIGKPLQGLKTVVREFEERFPDTKVEFLNVPGVREYLVTQLSSGRAPDIINVNVEDVWTDVQKGWYVALDPFLEQPNPFVVERGDPNAPGYKQWWDIFRYQAISRGKAAPDGLVYCLSYDMIETGLFYNKDIFKKVGVEVPQDWDQFLDVCKKVKAAGYTPVLMNVDMFSDWCTDLFFDQLYSNTLPGIDLFKDPKREPYLQGYLDWDEICFLHERGFFTPQDKRYRDVWRIMKEFRQYVNKNLSTTDMTREFVTQRGAMHWNSSNFTYRLLADPQLGFEWGVFYPPQFTDNTSPYASHTPMCVIGGSANQIEVTNSAFGDTGDPKTSERLKRVMALLQFMTVPENCERIVNEYTCLIPNTVGVPVLGPLKPFEEILERPYTTTKWVYTFDLKFGEIQRRMLELYLNDGITLDGFLGWQKESLDAACENLVSRKSVDMSALRATWDRQAPARATMKDLPHE
ncbi:MAG: extracellular solute-binding protein [Candidatus Hydrogenedentes bacterium]|nr:extracellular solute-binding protein [Candidatus Hydrogenedentota bacterium]